MAVPRKSDPGTFTRTSSVYQTGAQPRNGGTTTPSSTPSSASSSTPTMSFQDAVLAHQRANPVSTQAYEGLFPYLQNAGYQVTRPTHAGGTLLSDDKIVNAATGEVFDLISDVGGANQGWTFGSSGYWVNGAPSATPPGGTVLGGSPAATPNGTSQPGRPAPVGAPPPHSGNPNGRPTTGTAVPRGTPPGAVSSANTYAAAYDAQRRQRQQGRAGGRQAGIFAGFQPGRPLTNPATLLGS